MHWLAIVFLALAWSVRAQGLDRIRAMALAGSVLKVEAIGDGGGIAIGTAVSVAPGTFVTNCHVTRHAETVLLVSGGARWRAEAEHADLYLDVCLLRVSALADVPAIRLAPGGAPRVNQPVVAAGYTGGGGIQMSSGVVLALHRFAGSVVIQTTTAFASGASGGALFNASGELVGILTFRLRGIDGHYFAVPVAWVADGIADPRGFDRVAPLEGPRPFWAQAVALLPFFMQAASLEVDGRWNDLLELSDRWTSEAEPDPEAFFTRGKSLVRNGEIERAVDAYRRAIDLDPGYARAWLDLGKAYLLLGATADAAEAVAALQKLDPDAAGELAAAARAAGRGSDR